jgi:hypothetical protein
MKMAAAPVAHAARQLGRRTDFAVAHIASDEPKTVSGA